MKAAIYCRYSSDNQREASLEDQERRCRQETDRAGFQVVSVWQDAAISGALSEEQRPGLRAMLEAARQRAFDVLLVDDASRLSRDASASLKMLQRLDFWGVGFVAISDGISPSRTTRPAACCLGSSPR